MSGKVLLAVIAVVVLGGVIGGLVVVFVRDAPPLWSRLRILELGPSQYRRPLSFKRRPHKKNPARNRITSSLAR